MRSRWGDSNPQPADYKSAALPIEPHRREVNHVVGEGGFEPPKAVPADLQSVPFGHSGIPPKKVMGRIGLEPMTPCL